MLLISLQSGSSGNCIYVESRGVRLLFDAGLSATQVCDRLASHGRSAQRADALFISHDHYDHVRNAGVYTRAFEVPMYITKRTLHASRKAIKPNVDMEIEYFKAGAAIPIGHLTVETVKTPHDAADGVVFVVDDGAHRLGIATDVGHVFGDLKSLVASVDGLFLESNYDEEMLRNGPYPYQLKERISGSRGHISNRESAELVVGSASSKLQWLCLAHLSDKNNTPKKALAAHREAVGSKLPIQVTSRSAVTDGMSLDPGQPGSSLRRQMAFEF